MERAQLSIGQRLEQERLSHGWTQEYVAESIGVDPVTYRRWERGLHKPQPIHHHKLCMLFSKTKQKLGLCEEDKPSERPTERQIRDVVPVFTPVSDAFTTFRRTDLTTRLQSLVWSWLLRKTATARYQELQDAILIASLEQEDNTMNDEVLNRREALRRLASLPIDYCALSLFGPVLVRPVEEILAHCAAGITACWQLRKGKDLAFAFDTVSWYLPTLKEIVTTGTTLQRQGAADLLIQCLILQSELAMHVMTSNDAISYARQAEHYGEAAGNAILHILAVRRLEAAYGYAGYLGQAWRTAEQAKRLLLELEQERKQKKLEPIPQIVYSYIFAGLATEQAHNGRTQDALDSLGKAHTAFFAHPANEPVPIWIDNHSQANLVLNDGFTHLFLDKGKEAFDSFQQVTKQADSEVIRVEATVNQVMAEVNRDDQTRNMDACINLWTSGMQGAISLQSEQWFNEARVAYAALRAAWPKEQRVKDLREQIHRW
jgi:transcriptional regulator with XRE-family HTH domain